MGEPRPRLTSPGLAAATAAYAALAVAATWPLARVASTAVTPGTDGPATVPFASAWALWWTADRLPRGLSGWWDAPIFHDTPGVFAWSEAMPLPGVLAAPLSWGGAGPVLVANVVLLASLVLNGLAVAGLLRVLRMGDGAAFAGGAGAVTLPVVHAELGVLTLVPVWPIAATLAATVHLTRDPSATRGALLGGAVAATYLTCAQYGLFVVLAAAPAAGWLVRRDWDPKRTVAAVAAAAVVAGLLAGPLALAQRRAAAEAGLERTEERARKGSAHARAWTRTAWRQAVPTPGVATADDPGLRSLYPGTALLLLAIAGTVWGMRRAEHEDEVAFVATVALIALVLSLGPRLAPAYAVLREVVPGYAQIRSLWRFAFVAHVALAALAGVGVHGLLRAAGRRRPALVAVAAVAALAVVELWPGPVRTIEAPLPRDHAGALAWIGSQTAPDEPLAFLPFPAGEGSEFYAESAGWMVLQAAHGRPTVNGYSSYFPAGLKEVWAQLEEGPSDAGLDALAARGVGHVIVRRSWRDRAAVEAQSGGRLVWAAGWPDEDMDAYLLR